MNWNKKAASTESCFTFTWSKPIIGFFFRWRPDCRFDRNLSPSYGAESTSMLSSSAPLDCFYDGNSDNRYTWSLSECAKFLKYRSGVHEETGNLICSFSISVKQYTNQNKVRVAVRIDERVIPMCDVIRDVALWWQYECSIVPTDVPAAAKDSVYSFWYSYHQDLTSTVIEEECRRARELGFTNCIVDDGWQTDDSNKGYAFCGDWHVAQSKIPDMAAHVQRIHDMGMKYILWYSVPYMGSKAKHFQEFRDMLLFSKGEHCVLDPRYKRVRNYLIEIYKKALTEWNLDGFKLDFIDEWHEIPGGIPPYNPKMDIPVLYDAVDSLMSNIMAELKKIKPDVVIEFRQKYVGPYMRKYGNMFRVADCPGDIISNRVGVLDLRMLLGNAAVHSDMLMWNKDETPEKAALQIISILFGTMQYSQRLAEMPSPTLKMSKFWISFMRKHKDVLLESPLYAYEPHLLYTWAQAANAEESVAVVYSPDKCIKPKMKDTTYLINGSESLRILAELQGTYIITVLDCCGNKIKEYVAELSGINDFCVPISGMVVLKRSVHVSHIG